MKSVEQGDDVTTVTFVAYENQEAYDGRDFEWNSSDPAVFDLTVECAATTTCGELRDKLSAGIDDVQGGDAEGAVSKWRGVPLHKCQLFLALVQTPEEPKPPASRRVEDVRVTYTVDRSLDESTRATLRSFGVNETCAVMVVQEFADGSRAEEDMVRFTERVVTLQQELFARQGEVKQLRAALEATSVRSGDRTPTTMPLRTRRGPSDPRRGPAAISSLELKAALRRFMAYADRTNNDPRVLVGRSAISLEGGDRAGTGTIVTIVCGGGIQYAINVPQGTTFRHLLLEIGRTLAVPQVDGRFALVTEAGGVCAPTADVCQVVGKLDAKGRRRMCKLHFVAAEIPRYEDLASASDVGLASAIKRDYLQSRENLYHEVQGVPREIDESLLIEYAEAGPGAQRRHELLLADLAKFVAFALLFFVTTSLRYQVGDSFYLAGTARRALTEPTFGAYGERTFHSITTLEHVWEWLEGPLVDALSSRAGGGWSPQDDVPGAHVLGDSKVVGMVQLRQVRVQANRCELSPSEGVANFVQGNCFVHYPGDASSLGSDASKQPFGRGSLCRNQSAFQFREGGLGYESFRGLFGSYDPSGYYDEVDMTQRVAALGQLRGLQRCGWLDEQTRAVFASVNLYNRNHNAWLAVDVFFEHGASGRVQPTARVLTVNVDGYAPGAGGVLAAIDIILVLLFLWTATMWRQEVRYATHLTGSSIRMLRNGWVVMDMGVALAFLLGIIAKLVFFANPRRNLFDTQAPPSSPFMELGDLAYWQRMSQVWDGLVVVLCCIKTLKYYLLSGPGLVLVNGLLAAFRLILVYLVVFVLVFFGFVVVFFSVYGSQLHQFRRMDTTMQTLLTMMLGNNEGTAPLSDYPASSQLLLFAYVLCVYGFLLHMWIAIMSDAYGRANQFKEEQPGRHMTVTSTLCRKVIYDFWNRITCRETKVTSATAKLRALKERRTEQRSAVVHMRRTLHN